ncbi:hypothetical protein DNHGIG_39930 [Collibacillus ludicampi]|uniref:Type II secretion system protein GspF domain-containing protein n=1 Tax=Collibacillus ludicampi TaxID=2771369 RepID=A0AAV4LMN7_9BACL|nr:type II secretion system F family protein [Collibacillus ludicampi]GIM48444.1 hypothetical protein DNHGIG_39930 [Collibacillus ludicampi]
MEYMIGFLFAVAVFSAFLGVAMKREERQQALLSLVEGVEMANSSKSPVWGQKLEELLAKVFPSQLGLENLEKNLRQAGRPFGWDAHDVTVIRMIAGVGIFSLSLFSDTSLAGHILAGLLLGGIGTMFPYLLIWTYKTQRQAGIRRQFRSWLLTLSLLVKTDIRFDQAIHESIKITTGEFRKILEQFERRYDFRSTLDESFEWLADETGIKEIEKLYVVVHQTLKNGSKIEFALQAMLEELDEELQNKIEKLIQKVNLKILFTVIFLILGPSIFFEFVISGINFMNSFKAI